MNKVIMVMMMTMTMLMQMIDSTTQLKLSYTLTKPLNLKPLIKT